MGEQVAARFKKKKDALPVMRELKRFRFRMTDKDQSKSVFTLHLAVKLLGRVQARWPIKYPNAYGCKHPAQ